MTLTTARDAMSTDWITTLTEQARLVQRVTKETSAALAVPELTLDQSSRIYAMVEKGAQDFHRIVEGMNEQDLDSALYVAADRLRGIWAALSVTVADKVRVMQEHEPIEFPDEREE
jgi:hypothetical protein